jgi:hypothetical protein
VSWAGCRQVASAARTVTPTPAVYAQPPALASAPERLHPPSTLILKAWLGPVVVTTSYEMVAADNDRHAINDH